MPRYLNPATVPKPASRYSHGVMLGQTFKRLIVSGQVGAALDGAVPEGLEAQIEKAFDNFVAVVEAGGLGVADVVRIVCYATPPGAVGAFRAAREARFGKHAPASTFVQVAALADPAWLVEIEGEAVREA